jgi:hypothetical protein
MSTGTIAQASMAQTINWLGADFTINRKVATGYNAATTTATTSTSTQSVKGIIDNNRSPGFADLIAAFSGGTDVRGRQKAVIIPATDLDFVPGVGDTITSDSLDDSIRDVQILNGAEGAVLFYRLVLENG